jgi:hypothetical protein
MSEVSIVSIREKCTAGGSCINKAALLAASVLLVTALMGLMTANDAPNNGDPAWAAEPNVPMRYGGSFSDTDGTLADVVTKDVTFMLLIGALLFLASAVSFFLLQSRKEPEVTGVLTKDGEGLGGVDLVYMAEGKTRVAITDGSGKYTIRAAKGSKVEIILADGLRISGVSATVERRVTELDISL